MTDHKKYIGSQSEQSQFREEYEKKTREGCVLVFLLRQEDDGDLIEAELKALVKTSGLTILGTVKQQLRGRQQRLGRGKTEELKEDVDRLGADVVIFENKLSPSYRKDLEEFCAVKVIDKTALILDIFAQRAQSKEGKLQVELAQLQYLLPHLMGQGAALSRLGGGVGTRGPGETQLETDRRHIRKRITIVRERLKQVVSSRETQRTKRVDSPYKKIALVGYTNAGKSSLLSFLAQDDIYVQDELFATLDPTTRRVDLPSGKTVLMTDTVGFIRDLPPSLLDAFKATLEEIRSVDLLFHVIDAAQDGVEARMAVVDQVLKELNLEEKPRIYVFNKIDQIETFPVIPMGENVQPVIYLSTKTGEGMASMWAMLENIVAEGEDKKYIYLPFAINQGELLSKAHALGEVSDIMYREEGVYFYLTMKSSHPAWCDFNAYEVETGNEIF